MKSNSHKNRILIGPPPVPVTGQSTAFYSFVKTQSAVVIKVKHEKKYLNLVWFLWVMWFYVFQMFCGSKLVYITISRTRFGFLRDVFLIWVGKIFRAKIIVHLHGGDLLSFVGSVTRVYQKLIECTLKKVDIAVVLGESFRKQFNWCLPDSKIKIVENYFDTNGYLLEQNKRDWQSDVLRVLFMANVLPSKGLFVLLDAIAECKYSNKINLLFAGDIIAEKPYTYTQIKDKLKWYEDNMLFKFQRLGVLKGLSKWETLESAHVFALPTCYLEGQPISIIEAMAAGCVILTTRHGGIPEIITDMENGVFCDAKHRQSVAQKIEWCYENRNILSQISANNYAVTKNRYKLETYLDNLECIMSNIQ